MSENFLKRKKRTKIYQTKIRACLVGVFLGSGYSEGGPTKRLFFSEKHSRSHFGEATKSPTKQPLKLFVVYIIFIHRVRMSKDLPACVVRPDTILALSVGCRSLAGLDKQILCRPVGQCLIPHMHACRMLGHLTTLGLLAKLVNPNPSS